MARLLFLALFLIPSAGGAQTPVLRISAGGRTVDAVPERHRGYVAHRSTTLRALGAQVETQPWGAVVVLFGDTLRFETLSPFFRAGGRAQQLAAPTYSRDGLLYLPRQFFVEWLPARYPDRLDYRSGRLALVADAAAAPAHPAPVGAVLDAQPIPPLRERTTGGEERPVTGGRAPAAGERLPDGRERMPAAGERLPDTGDSLPGAGGPLPAGDRRPDAEERVRVVIIDAGHGGPDPGRIGPTGVREKDVALVIATRLAALLRERSGYEVHLTRTTDTLIALDDRPRKANEWKAGRPAALFLSIHANAFSPEVQGFETFFLSDARTEDERRVAEMENAAVAYEDNGAAQPTDDLEHILNTLRNNFYIHASNDLAEVIQRRLAAFHPGPNRGVKQAGFRVLVGAFMPAVLVETAFISNPEEARLLGTSAFQQKIAWALAEAIDRFFSTHEHLWTVDGR